MNSLMVIRARRGYALGCGSLAISEVVRLRQGNPEPTPVVFNVNMSNLPFSRLKDESSMVKQQPLRQRIRKGVILTTFLLFPIIMNYFSPYVIIDGASQGIVNGSFIVFGADVPRLSGARPRVVRVGLPGGRAAGGRVRDQQRPVQDRQARLDQVVHLGCPGSASSLRPRSRRAATGGWTSST